MPADDLARALLVGDADGVRALVAAEWSAAPPPVPARRPVLRAAQAFAAVLDTDFAAARALADPHDDDPGLLAVAAVAAGISGIGTEAGHGVPTAAASLARAPSDPWPLCLHAEAAMSLGRLAEAERLARAVWDEADPADPRRVFAGQTLARALLFQGRLTESRSVCAAVLSEARRHDLVALMLVLLGTEAYLAALSRRPADLDRCVGLIEATVDAAPVCYVSTGGVLMACFALAADGQATRAATLMLGACGGPSLPRLQVVDRAYGYELLTAAALASGDVEQARGHVAAADRLTGFPAGGMTAAAVQRTAALVVLADGDHAGGADLARQAQDMATSHSGHLDATRAQLLAGSALLRTELTPTGRLALQTAAERATAMGAVVLRASAVRDLRSVGVRLAGGGPPPMSGREREVAELVARGLSNAAIAAALGISARTVQSHVARVLLVLGLPSRSTVPRALRPAGTEIRWAALTARQRQVTRLVGAGYTNAGIAAALDISVKTVEKHLGDIYVRLDVLGRTALAAQVPELDGGAQTIDATP